MLLLEGEFTAVAHATNWALAVAGGAIAIALGYAHLLAQKIETPSSQPVVAASTRPPAPSAPATLTVAADSRGHYLVHPTIENYRVKMMVDTGASIVALTAEDARALGISAGPNPRHMQLGTANGSVTGFRTVIREIRLGGIVVRDVDAVVLPKGALGISLLGNSFLGKLGGYEVQTGRMVLRG